MEALADVLCGALDFALQGDIEKARSTLANRHEAPARKLTALLDREAKRRHDNANLISIARASVEGMLDGMVPIEHARLERVRAILEDLN